MSNRAKNIAVIGKSGAGKTTLLRSLCGLLEPETGSVQINGDQASSIPEMRFSVQLALYCKKAGYFQVHFERT